MRSEALRVVLIAYDPHGDQAAPALAWLTCCARPCSPRCTHSR